MKGKKIIVSSLLSASLSLTSLSTFVSAQRTGFNALDQGIEMISKLFYPSILLRNQNVQIGFYKFLYFLIIFATVNWILGKVFNKGGSDKTGGRAANVVSFSFAAIAAWFMPTSVALGSAGLIAALLNAAIPLAICGGAMYLAFAVLNKTWWQHLLGAAVILFAMVCVSWLLAII